MEDFVSRQCGARERNLSPRIQGKNNRCGKTCADFRLKSESGKAVTGRDKAGGPKKKGGTNFAARGGKWQGERKQKMRRRR